MTTNGPITDGDAGKPLLPQSGVAAVRGSLHSRPLPRLIQQLFRKRIVGSLVITDDAGDMTRVFLREGFPVHAERPNDIDRLDRILVGSGLISREVAAEADQEVARTGRRLGDVLVARGAITRETLADSLKAQMRRKLTRLFFATHGTYEFYPDAHNFGLGDEFDSMRVDPRGLLYRGIRAAYDDERLRRELAPLAGYSFRLVSVPPVFLRAMGFPDGDLVLTALRERALTLDELLALPVKPTEARSVTLALLYSDLLNAQRVEVPSDDAVPVPVAPESSGVMSAGPIVAPPGFGRTTWTSLPVVADMSMPSPSRSSSSLVAVDAASAGSLRSQLLELTSKFDRVSHFELLSVPETATAAEVDAAYVRSMRQFHPDRLAAAGLRDLRAQAETIVARMAQAVAVLNDPKRRSTYLAGRSVSAPVPVPTQAPPAAEFSLLPPPEKESQAPAPPPEEAQGLELATPLEVLGAGTGSTDKKNVLEAENRFLKGEVALGKGEAASAVEFFRQAIKLNPEEVPYRAYLAWATFLRTDNITSKVPRESLATLDEVVRARPHFGRAHYWAGQIHKFLKELDQARRCFELALRVDPTIREADYELRALEARRSSQSSGFLRKIFKKN